MKNILCDFHTHSTASDGSDTPTELIEKALEAGVKSIALTDHDTVEGIDEASCAAEEKGVDFIPGVELSVVHDQGNMHMLGYLMDHKSQDLNAVLEKLQKARSQRNEKMIELLNEIGRPVSMEELQEIAVEGQVGRPHFARAMVNKGYVSSVGEAFERYLKRGAPAYIPKSILSAEDAVKLVHDAGGVAVLAHPCSLKTVSMAILEEIIAGLAQNGLDGVECHYSEHDRSFTKNCVEIAAKYDLIVTGGSDYHGKAKPHIKLGKGRGGLKVPCECAEALRERKRRI